VVARDKQDLSLLEVQPRRVKTQVIQPSLGDVVLFLLSTEGDVTREDDQIDVFLACLLKNGLLGLFQNRYGAPFG
jgi:hypothetical protein